MMRHLHASLLAFGLLGSLCSTRVAAQASGYCPVYADNNWRLSWVEEELHAWTKDQRGSTDFDAHLNFCKAVFRDDPDNARQILHDEWEARHARIVDRLASWSAQDMVGYLEAWPNNLSYICDTYADFNTGLSQVASYLDADIGSLETSDHRDYCINSVYQNRDEGLEAQQSWAGRYDSVVQIVMDHSAI
jgi:hypothetical protein